MQSKQDLDLQKNFIGFKAKIFELHRNLDEYWPIVNFQKGKAGPEEYRAYIKLLFNTYDSLAKFLSGSSTFMTHQLLALGRKALAEDAAILAIKREANGQRLTTSNILGEVSQTDKQNIGMSFDLGAAYVLSASCFGASMISKMLYVSDFGLYMPTNYIQMMSAETSLLRYQTIKTRILRDVITPQDWEDSRKGAETVFHISMIEAKKISTSLNVSKILV